MILLTKLPPLIPARSPRKSSGSAHMMLNPSSIGEEFPYRSNACGSRQQPFFQVRIRHIDLQFSLSFSSTHNWIPGVLVYQKHMEKQAHLPAEKRFVSCKALVIEKKIIEHASVAWLGIFLQCSLPN